MKTRCLRKTALGLHCALAMLLMALGCHREERRFNDLVLPNPAGAVSHVDLYPGEQGPPALPPNPYENNAVALSEGQRLFSWYNCSGCHANGGGGMGPALTDDTWIYGSEPAQIFATIVEGRPNGMPSFRGKIPDSEVWQLATFVRALSGQVRQDVASSRQDHMQAKPVPLQVEQAVPHDSSEPRP